MVCQIKLPPLLAQIPDPPKQLYIEGDPKILFSRKIISIVGTRQMTKYGQEVTSKLTRELVERGFVIVSGLALGIDGVAHEEAIKSGGKTVAVLGAGVDIIYPRVHSTLYKRILEHKGAIISEVAPGKFVPREKFAARNRIISGLARAVIIPEANLRSGSMITARLALDQGRDVYCIPGSEGTDFLIDQGALVWSPKFMS